MSRLELPPGAIGGYQCELTSLDEFLRYAHQSTDLIFAGSSMIKGVVQLFGPEHPEYRPTVYYLDAHEYEVHVPFCKVLGKYLSTHGFGRDFIVNRYKFNQQNYDEWPRSWILLTFVYYPDRDLFIVELWPSDSIPPEGVQVAHDAIRESAFFKDKMKWAIHSPLQEEVFRQVSIPDFYDDWTIRNSDLFIDVAYQPLFLGEAYGTVSVWRNLADPIAYGSDSILVADQLPLDLNPVRALVTQQLQTPLCHVALLCANRQTPNMASRDAIARFSALEGRLVHLVIGQNDFTVAEAAPADAHEWLERQARRRRFIPPLACSFELTELTFVRSLAGRAAFAAVGAKASNLAQITNGRIPHINNAANNMAFVVPFFFWHEFVNLVAPAEYARMRERNIGEDEAKALCRTLREKIEGAAIGEWADLRARFLACMKQWEGGIPATPVDGIFCDGVILRSSTNCEDLPGFPSAGLYHSDVVPLFEWPDIEKGILRVWASAFSERAYLERREYGLNEENVAMAILAMPLLRRCVFANGVAVTENPYRPDLGGILLNVQVGTTAVTDACGGAIPEQVVIVWDGSSNPALQFIAGSSLVPMGQYILTREVALHLNQALITIQRVLQPVRVSGANAIDAEFFILKNSEIVVVQARAVFVQSRECKKNCDPWDVELDDDDQEGEGEGEEED